MRRILARVPLVLFVLAAVAIPVLAGVVAPRADARFNAVTPSGPDRVSERAASVHREAQVVDLHADSLLWGRDLSKRHARGHADLPRLVEGGVDLQVFGVVTASPKGQNVHENTGDTDRLPLLFFATLRPPGAWFGRLDRALSQARELAELARTDDRLLLVRTRGDLDAALGTDAVGGLLGLEGMHALEGDEAALDTLFDAGFRMMAPTHFFDTEVAGSAHGVGRGGLTDLGRRLVPRMEALGITVDLAHASPAAIDDILAIAERPVVVSHTGVQGTCPGPRNLSDEQLRAIAANGGVVGIGYFDDAVCGTTADHVVRALLHTVEVAGVDHAALGSDFDGAVATGFDTTGVVRVTHGLLEAGMREDDVHKVLGGNALRVLRANLPE